MTTGFDYSCGLLKARENLIVKWFEWARGQWQCYLRVCEVPYFQFSRAIRASRFLKSA